MADCPKYRYVDSWTQPALNVWYSNPLGYAPVTDDYNGFQITAFSVGFGPWPELEIHIECMDAIEVDYVRQSFEYKCYPTDTYPKTFGAASLAGGIGQVRYYVQITVNHPGDAIAWDFQLQFLGDCVAIPCPPVERWCGSHRGGFGDGQVPVGDYVSCPSGWDGMNWTVWNDTVGGSSIGVNLRFYNDSLVEVGRVGSPTIPPQSSYTNNVTDTGWTEANKDAIRWVRMYGEVFGDVQDYTICTRINEFYGCPLPVAFYLCSEDQAGFHYDGSIWTQYGPPLTGPSIQTWVPVAASVTSEPSLVYVLPSETTNLFSSTDGGLTWTQRALPSGLVGGIWSLWARAPDEVYLLEAQGHPTISGIWRTLNGGVNWTRIVPFTTTITRGGQMALGITKLFYAQPVVYSTSPSPSYMDWVFNRINLDGTGLETLAPYTFSEADGLLPTQFLLRAISDDFVLVTNLRRRLIWRIDADGIRDVRPATLPRPWDAIPLTATRWLAVGQPSSGTDVLVLRTDDAGLNWTLMTTIPSAQGFAVSGSSDLYHMIIAAEPSVSDDVIMLGNASSTIQQIIWVSTDAGATWTSMVNTAVPIDEFGDWMVYQPGSLGTVSPAAAVVPQVAIPSRLATIVG